MHNMEKCGRGKGRPQGCSLRSHRRRRLAPLPPPFSPAPMLRHVVYASLLHFGVETAAAKVAPKSGHFSLSQTSILTRVSFGVPREEPRPRCRETTPASPPPRHTRTSRLTCLTLPPSRSAAS